VLERTPQDISTEQSSVSAVSLMQAARSLLPRREQTFMTIFDPISGRQIIIDLSGKLDRSIVRQNASPEESNSFAQAKHRAQEKD
jgi:hypothetical protein